MMIKRIRSMPGAESEVTIYASDDEAKLIGVKNGGWVPISRVFPTAFERYMPIFDANPPKGN